MGAAALVAFLLGRESDGDAAQTMAFTTVAFSELALVFALRSPIHPAWEAPRNRYLVGSVVVSGALVLVMVYLPVLNDPLGTVPLPARELLLTALLAVVPFLCVEAGKLVFRRTGRTLEGLLE